MNHRAARNGTPLRHDTVNLGTALKEPCQTGTLDNVAGGFGPHSDPCRSAPGASHAGAICLRPAPILFDRPAGGETENIADQTDVLLVMTTQFLRHRMGNADSLLSKTIIRQSGVGRGFR